MRRLAAYHKFYHEQPSPGPRQRVNKIENQAI